MGITFSSFLVEKMVPSETLYVDSLVEFISSQLDVEEMRGSRGERSSTGTIEVRLKPKDKDMPLDDILDSLKTFISKHAKNLNAKDVKINPSSPNSSKFSSVSFEHDKKTYDLVVAKGGNKGEKYESALLDDLESHIAGLDSSESPRLLAAMEKADKKFKATKVIGVSGRSGSTRRSSSTDLGSIIADIILTMENGDKKYLSIKNKTGATFANLGGIGAMFENDFTIDMSSPTWKILKDFGFEPDKITKGLQAYVSGKSVDFEVNVLFNKTIKSGSKLQKFLADAWGHNYYYVREHSHNFKVLNMTEDFVINTLLANLKIQEIRYPFANSKQVAVKFGNEFASYKLEIRNPHGARAIKPSDAKIKITRLELA